jgi:DNA-binding winged helix-turn-helix (wHTH) protein/tetratricopeptide (TPR) repeat protein
MTNKQFYEFGPFRLDPAQRELSCQGQPISLTPKAFDVLVFLVVRREQLVSKAELMAAVWPDTSVEEGNLAWNVSAIRKALGDEGGAYIETVPKFGYRFVAHVREVQDQPAPVAEAVMPAPPPVQDIDRPIRRRGRIGLYVAAIAVLAIASLALTYPWSPPPILAERDPILIASIDNRTGLEDFDDILTDTVVVQFDQSPYFRVLSQDRINEQLQMMRRQAGERVTDSMAREICERAGVKAFITGSIVRIGSDHVITLAAVNGRTGDALARDQQTVPDAAGVLRAVGAAATTLRRNLGESIQSVERFDVSPEVATTASLPALRAFREGLRLMAADQSPKAVAFFQRAVELDSDFAIAYARLAAVFVNLNDRRSAEWAAREAFLRRDRVSERERHEIDAKYYRDVTGEVSKAVEAMELGARLFPDDARAQNLLQLELRDIGRIKEAVVHGEQAVKFNPRSTTYRSNLIGSYIRVGDLEAARTVRDNTERDGLATAGTRRLFRLLAAVADDRAATEREEAWQQQNRSDAAQLSDFVASQSGVNGRLADARTQYRDLIQRTEARRRPALAATFLSRFVIMESLLDPEIAAAGARDLLTRDPSRYEAAEAAFALALGKGDLSHINALAAEHSQDQLLNGLWLPMSQAVVEIRAGRAEHAVPRLRTLDNYDLGDFAALRPSYFLGQAHLALGNATDARAAFEKVIRYRGVVHATPLYGLSHLGLARAEGLAKRTAEAKMAYERFFAVWKDADPQLQIMKAARTEYARLK